MEESKGEKAGESCAVKLEERVVTRNDYVKQWLDKFNRGTLRPNDFTDLIRYCVPRLYSPQPGKNCLELPVRDDHLVNTFLFETFECFLCGTLDKPDLFRLLTTIDVPPSVCGKVFKYGEPTYHCRQCGMDGTCVLCVDCFKQSPHRSHKYKMGTSGGGGCCDCGDVEAWKQDPYCDNHQRGLEKYIHRILSLSYTSLLPKEYSSIKFPEGTVPPPDSTRAEPAEMLNKLSQNPKDSADVWPSLMMEVDDVEVPEDYCTVLYNDETHTFEQVITTVGKVIRCSQRDAIEYVTTIDREGRAIVNCGQLDKCLMLKKDIEHFTSRHGNVALKVQVTPSDVIAHQVYCLRLLPWLQRWISVSEGLRKIFTQVMFDRYGHNPSCILEGVLLRDSYLWKSARLNWHRIIIAGMLPEYENKKALAKAFTCNYGTIMKDFVTDDHDINYSIASLGIQVFTVPTLAHYLIAEESAFLTLSNTFLSECSHKCSKAGKLEFERNAPNNSNFKRAQHVLFDLRYLLGVPPKEWDTKMRTGFLEGIRKILTLLSQMQEMDSVTRQVGHHMEYEPEWESAFNLHIKLAPVIDLVLKWCSTDKEVLIKTYQYTLKRLQADLEANPQQTTVRELADHSATCLNYNVSLQPVSIHLPLSRFLAGLHLHLQSFGLHFDDMKDRAIIKLTPVQIIEPVLRTQVLIAQVHSGMWRRNGYSISNQIFFYHNVKCRTEMLDRDIVLLQVGASLIESNDFLIHCLNKFDLMSWADVRFELRVPTNPLEDDLVRQTVNLVEEFLSMLISIIGERYVVGVGKVSHEDCIRKQIVQVLCIRPHSHSELTKALPDCCKQNESLVERVVNEVAEFKKPNEASSKGVYVLNKEFIHMYDAFYYHYSKEELSKSEDNIRQHWKTNYGLECCPPPTLPELEEPFTMVVNLLQCDVMLHLIHIILERAINLHARSFSENQVHKIFHLIGYALHEEEQARYPFFQFIERAEKWGIDALLEEISNGLPRVEGHKDLIQWTVNKFRTLSGWRKQMETPTTSLTHYKKVEQDEKELKAKLAAERRAKIMEQMAALQKNFMKDNANFFSSESSTDNLNSEMESTQTSVVESTIALGPHQSPRPMFEKTVTCILCQEDQKITAHGSAVVMSAYVQNSMVLCRDRSLLDPETEKSNCFLNSILTPAPHISSCGHLMHSTCSQKYIENIVLKESRRPYRLRQPSSFDVEKNEFLCPLCECLSNTLLPVLPFLGLLSNMDNKAIDGISFDNWVVACRIAIKHRNKATKLYNKGGPMKKMKEDVPSTPTQMEVVESGTGEGQEEAGGEAGEGASSTEGGSGGSQVVSSATGASALNSSSNNSQQLEFPDTMSSDESDEDSASPLNRCINLQDVVLRLSVFSRPVKPSYSSEFDPNDLPILSPDLTDRIFEFARATYIKGVGVNVAKEDVRVPLLTWKACAYTVHCVEQLQRYSNKPLFANLSCRQQDCLESLVRLSAVLGRIWKDNQVINRHGVKLLAMVIVNKEDGPAISEWDSFGLLVPLTMALPSMFNCDPIPIPQGNVFELHTFVLMLYSQIAQILLNTELEGSAYRSTSAEAVEDTRCLEPLAKIFLPNSHVNTDQLWMFIKKQLGPYLRCCALFYHFLTGVPAPEALTVLGGDTFENLCSYLGIASNCKALFAHENVYKLFKQWSSHERLEINLKKSFLTINRLVSLPEDYSELINTVSVFTCPNSDRDDSRNPTMCLICGEMLCSQTYCCQTELHKNHVGACTYHTHFCGGGAGIFLRVRECEILFLASPNRGCFASPPYLDCYGETDQGLHRGNPLYLCKPRYQELQLLWLSHSVHNEIARAVEANKSGINTQWQHL